MCFQSHIIVRGGENVHISLMKRWKVFIFLHYSNNRHKLQRVELQMNSETVFLFSVFSSRLLTTIFVAGKKTEMIYKKRKSPREIMKPISNESHLLVSVPISNNLMVIYSDKII